MEIKTEADSNDITEYSLDDRPSTGMFVFIILYFVHHFVSTAYARCVQCLCFVLCPQYWPSKLKVSSFPRLANLKKS